MVTSTAKCHHIKIFSYNEKDVTSYPRSKNNNFSTPMNMLKQRILAVSRRLLLLLTNPRQHFWVCVIFEIWNRNKSNKQLPPPNLFIQGDFNVSLTFQTCQNIDTTVIDYFKQFLFTLKPFVIIVYSGEFTIQ